MRAAEEGESSGMGAGGADEDVRMSEEGEGQGGGPSGVGGKRRRRGDHQPGEKSGQSRQDAARRLREGGGCGTAPA